MSVDNLLALLDHVRPTSKGWSARCPAHADRSPSLSITERDRKVLVHCFAGCRLEQICAALGLTMRDLFYDTTTDPRALQAARRKRQRLQQATSAARRRDHRRLALVRPAEQLIAAAHDLDISPWSDEKLHRELETLANAYDAIYDALTPEERNAFA